MNAKRAKPFVLLTNDDGIASPGLSALAEVFAADFETAIVAPATEMSAVGHAITLSDPLRVTEFFRDGRFYGYAVKGTPADCVKIGYWAILKRKPDVVISGINRGPNTGINTIYSGTVSAATEGTILGVPSFAISLNSFTSTAFGFSARFAKKLTRLLLQKGLPAGVSLNVNVPEGDEKTVQGVAITRQGRALYREKFHKRLDPHKRTYYWLDGEKLNKEKEISYDDGAIDRNMISITPIQYDLTHYGFLDTLGTWDITL